MQPGIVLFEEGCGFLEDDPVIASLVPDEVICVTELVESEVLASYSEDEGAFDWGVGVFPVWTLLDVDQDGRERELTPFPPLNGIALHVIYLGFPSCQRKTRASRLVLQVLPQQDAGLLGGALILSLELVQQRGVIRVASLIISENRAVVGVGVVQIPLLRECPDWVLLWGD